MTGGDWHDSLFKDEKGDSLGDGTWGKPDPNEGKLAPVEWDKLPEAPDPSKKVRARLATPAPGSQKESGLLDIKILAPSLAAGMRTDEPELARVNRQPTPPPTARLATAAKGSAGSGLIDVQELVRLQEQREQNKDRDKVADSVSVAEAAIEAMNSSASMSGSSMSTGLSSSGAQPKPVVPDGLLDDLDELPNRNRSTLMILVVVLTLAFAGLAVYILTAG
jgi:hypothetical protein